MGARLAVVAVALASGCGRLAFEPVGAARDDDGGGDAPLTERSQQAYVKAGMPGFTDYLGWDVALSADGSTLAVGAPGEASNATGINGDQSDNSAMGTGAVFVFARTGTTWNLEAYVKASNAGSADQFGGTVALSADGATLAVGAVSEASSASGINGNQNDDSTNFAGAAYVFTRAGTGWSQQAYVKSTGPTLGAYFGSAVALSGSGDYLAVGASGEAGFSGAAHLFTRAGVTWSAQTTLQASNPGTNDNFGHTVVLSTDGATLAVGAPGESSAATGIDGNQADDSANTAGAVYIFVRTGSVWNQQAYVKASNTDAVDQFGVSLALSDDGATLAVGAETEDGGALGVGGNEADESAQDAGAAYVFTRAGTIWMQEAYVKPSNTGVNDKFGSAIALTGDGAGLVVGAAGESSRGSGIGGNPDDNSVSGAGATYGFTRTNALWTQHAYIKASNPDLNDNFGLSLAVSADGTTLAVGAFGEDSGIPGDESSNGALDAGAVYVFR